MSKGYVPSTEQKQYLNISDHAYETLENDIDIFSEKGGKSGIVNRILLNFMDDSDASITSAVERKRQEYTEILQNDKMKAAGSLNGELPGLSASEKRTIDTLLSDYRSKLTEYYLHGLPSKGKAFSVRLQNKIYEILGLAPLRDECYKGTGDYIRAILEDYSSKSLFQRESIYFREIVEIIQSKLLIPEKDRPLVTIKTRSEAGDVRVFRAKPYALSKESDAPYHYLIAVSRPAASEKNIYKPAAFRLSRIEEIYDTRGYGSGKITAKEKNALEDGIKSKSILYLLDDINEYAVNLTPAGAIKYKTILHLRPMADTSKTESLGSSGQVMYFRCTYRQLENYFFQFGKEAKILAPKEANDRFKAAYKAAFDNYE